MKVRMHWLRDLIGTFGFGISEREKGQFLNRGLRFGLA
jgi:hypothetical protein